MPALVMDGFTDRRTLGWSLAALLLGLLAFPLSSPQVFGREAVSLLFGLVAMVAAGIGYFGQTEPTGQAGEGGSRINVWLLGAVILAVAVGNVSRPWLTTALAVIAILLVASTFVLQAGPSAVRGLVLAGALAGAVLGAHGIACFAHARGRTAAVDSTVAAGAPSTPVPVASDAQPIELKPHFNMRLNESIFGNTLYDDSFSGLPAGRQVLGGIPFDIEGIVMMSGKLSVKYGFRYPPRVEISTHLKCQRLHLLGGMTQESNENYGVAIADVVFKYENGSQASTELVVGYNTLNRLGLGTESLDDLRSSIVWAGANGLTKSLNNMAFIKLRLCKTVIVNPHPEWEVQSVVYQSRGLTPSPFLVAITAD